MKRHFIKSLVLAASNPSSIGPNVFKLDTDTSYYNNFLNERDLEYMQKSKNRTGEVVYMTPSEYYQECASKIFQETSVDNLKKQRGANADRISQYKEDMLAGDKFPLCYLNYPDHAQEGLHRMMAAGEAFGWDVEFPVLVVQAVDDRLEQLNNLWRDWVDSVSDAEEFTYDKDTWEQELIEEVEYNMERRTGQHYDVIITDRRDREECAKYDMDYAIEIALAEFQDIMHPNTVFEPKFRTDDEDGQHIDLDIDDFDIEDLEDDLFI